MSTMQMRSLLAFAWLWVLLGGPPAAGARPDAEERAQHQAAADAFFTNSSLHVLKLEIPKTSMTSLRREPRTYVPALLREGPTLSWAIQVRVKGGWGSFRSIDDKPGLTVKIDDSSPRFYGLKKFHLNNSVQDHTYLSEWTCGELFRQADVPAGRVAHSVVERNGTRLGMYILLESINRDLLERSFVNTQGNVYSRSANADITEPLEITGGDENSNRSDLKALAAAAREPDLARLRARLPEVLDLDRFLSFMALEAMLDHWDGYSFNVKNYLVYHDLDADKMVFIPHDLDQMMRNANAPVMPRPQGIVARAIMRHPELRAMYRARFEEIYRTNFVASAIAARIDQRVAALSPALWKYDPQLAKDFVNSSANLKARIQGRARVLAAQLQQPLPTRLAVRTNDVLVTGWRIANEQKSAEQSRVKDPAGKSLLRISASGPSTASWRARVTLEPGRYRFVGQVRTVGVEPIPNDQKGDGAGLRLSGVNRPPGERLRGDSPWKRLAVDFDVTADQPEVDLICELRAQKGEVWFDEQSLRLARRQ